MEKYLVEFTDKDGTEQIKEIKCSSLDVLVKNFGDIEKDCKLISVSPVSSSRPPNHPLIDLKSPWIEITFIHEDGKEHSFYSGINTLSGDRLSAFDKAPPTINESIGEVKNTIRNIKRKATIVSVFGSQTFLA